MNASEVPIREIITKVLEESVGKGSKPEFEKHIDPSGIIGIKTSIVKCKPFRQDGVKFKDVVTLEEAPRIGCGIAELDHINFEWVLTYDEYDLVLDGILEIGIDGHVVPGGPDDIIYIPKGNRTHFRIPDRTRHTYFVHLADWQQGHGSVRLSLLYPHQRTEEGDGLT